jgi:two-component system NarL family response regulator
MTGEMERAEVEKIRVIVVDDHEVVRVGLCESLAAEPDMVVVGEARTGAEGVRLAEQHRPDVVLLDARLEDMDGPDVCRRLVGLGQGLAVVMLTGHTQEGLIVRCLAAGARGYVVKDIELSELKRAIRSVHRGHTVLDPKIAGSLVARMTRADRENDRLPVAAGVTALLSDLEVRIVRQLADGLTVREIAEGVHLSPHTIKDRLAKIRGKLAARSRATIVAEALKRGLI